MRGHGNATWKQTMMIQTNCLFHLTFLKLSEGKPLLSGSKLKEIHIQNGRTWYGEQRSQQHKWSSEGRSFAVTYNIVDSGTRTFVK